MLCLTLSPNHTETLSLLALTRSPADLLSTLEVAAARIIALGPRRGVVIRAGAHGAYYIASGQTIGRWVPPYHTSVDRVIDPTGAGNAFMGALAAALGEGKSLEEGELNAQATFPSTPVQAVKHQGGAEPVAVRWGSIAASFMIEQDGLPVLSLSDKGDRELWNGVDPWQRLSEWVYSAEENQHR